MTTIKTNTIRWLCTSPGVVTSLLDGATQNFATTPVPIHTRWGYYPQRQAGENREQAAARVATACSAQPEIIRDYDNSGGTSLPPSFGGANADLDFINDYTTEYAGTTVFNGSFRYVPNEVTAGTHDTDITNLFTAMIARNVKFYWTYCHEFDGAIYGVHGGQILLTEWAAAQQHIYTLAQGLSTTMLPSVVTFTSQSFNGAATTLVPSNQQARCNSYYPFFEGFCDGIGVDPYTQTSGQTAQQLAGSYYATVLALNAPFFCIPEIGTKNGLSTADITTFVQSLQYFDQKAEFVAYFDDSGSPYQRFDNIPAAAAFYGTLMNHTA